MMHSQTPKFAVILMRFVRDEALAGDLLEEFQAGRSHLWLWRQVLVAIAVGLWGSTREVRPLRLVEGEPIPDYAGPDARGLGSTPINLTAAPRGAAVGGLGLVALAALVTVVLPQAWWLLGIGALGGVLLGIVMTLVSRRRVLSMSDDRRADVLFGRLDTKVRTRG